MNLILFDQHEVDPRGCVSLNDGRATHLLQVLKVVPGTSVRVGIVNGAMGVGSVHAVGRGTVDLACTFEAAPPPQPAIDVLLALPRPKVMRRLFPQLAAIGVGHIILTNAERVERDYFDTHILSPETYRPLLIEGLQQARDTRLPSVSVHRRFRMLVEDELDRLFPTGHRLLAEPSADRTIADESAGEGRLLIAIGPEGGWNEFERRLLADHGFREVGMGPRTLRTDTASIALLALASAALRAREP